MPRDLNPEIDSGVADVLRIDDSSPTGRAAFDRPRGLVTRQQAAVAGAGMVSLPSPSCPAT